MVDKSKHAERDSDHQAEQTTAGIAESAESNSPEPMPKEPLPKESKPKAPMPQEPMPQEHGGPKGLEPTRYGDWEKNGRCTDF